MISVKKLYHQVSSGDEKLVILNNLSFSIDKGRSVAITGSSGSGKTTLLSLLAGLETPSSGEIMVLDQCLSSMNEDQRASFRAQYVGFVFQSFHLISGLTALENVALPLELSGQTHAQATAKDYLCKMGLAKRLHHRSSQLSGGEQQRVALARAFCVKPPLLFADEPTGNLDEKTGQQIIDLLFTLHEETQSTLILVTHEARLAKACDQTLILAEGQLHEN
ncbi:MAG: ABC transporter ATP-binding protein [Cellvibrionales bacterium]|nr:ABC transporter ATP-binding protein [Cellvibrionales bacterium]